MRRSLCLLPLVVLSLGSCLPFSMTQGSLGANFFPWEFLTQYAYWDSNDYVANSDGRLVLEERRSEDGGAVLHIRLYGFMFNPSDDRRTWNAEQWRAYRQGLETEPVLTIRINQADQLKAGDEIEYDSRDAANIDQREPHVDSVSFSPGNAPMNSSTEYPDEVVGFGSRRQVKIKLDSVNDQPGMGTVINGTIEYSREAEDGDPDDAVEGEMTVNFAAMLIGERLAECNDSTTEFGTLGGTGASACANLNPAP